MEAKTNQRPRVLPTPAIKNKPVPKQTTSKKPHQSVKPQSPAADSGRDYSQEEVKSLIIQYSTQYGIASGTPICIAKHESGFNPNSRNKSSSASGVFQYLPSTFKGTDEGKVGQSIFNPEANIKAAIKYMASRKSTSPWISTAKNCPPLKFL